jgi:hypothetical protein
MTSVAGSTARVPSDRGVGRGLSAWFGHGWWSGPVPVTLAIAGVLHVVWATLLATSGGDIAAQDAWAEFARAHPDVAYDLGWYGGMHPVSYSVISPYIMAWGGVRTTMVVAGTLSAGLIAWLIQRSGQVTRPMWPSAYAAVALFGNAISGRVTFALGVLLALTAIALVTVGRDQEAAPRRHLLRTFAAVSTALATAASPVAGLFLGLIAAALWLTRRRTDAYALGVPPVVVVLASALLFPFSGQQPMAWYSAILPFVVPACIFLFVPMAWRTVRVTAVIYAAAVLAAWLLPSPIGTNVVRLGLLFGGVVLAAALASQGWRTSWWASWWDSHHDRASARTLLALALVTATLWQAGVAGMDAVKSRPSLTAEAGVPALVSELKARDAELGRVEVVPTRSHREASVLAPYVNLARGWNRQADVGLNQLFYRRETISPTAYHRWLKRWAVSYVVISSAEPDPAAVAEAELVASRPSYLHEVWSSGDWTLFEVSGTQPLVDAPATVIAFDAAMITISTPEAGTFTLRIPASPWLALVDADGKPLSGDDLAGACLSAVNTGLTDETQENKRNWVLLHAPASGTYRISAPYKLPRGSSCS